MKDRPFFIGSWFLNTMHSDFKRKPKDIDLVVGSIEQKEKLDLDSWLPTESLREIHKEVHVNPVYYEYYKDLYNNGLATPITARNALFTLKVSHLFWDIQWEKHIYDVSYMKEHRATIIPELLNDLYMYWEIIHGFRKTSDLTMTPQAFFTNAIKCPIPHDEIHEKLNPNPIYKEILVGDGTVNTDPKKFEALSDEKKQSLIREECYVMAYERYRNLHYVNAYRKMLKKLILHHLPVEQALYGILHHKELHTVPINYYKVIETNNKVCYQLKIL